MSKASVSHHAISMMIVISLAVMVSWSAKVIADTNYGASDGPSLILQNRPLEMTTTPSWSQPNLRGQVLLVSGSAGANTISVLDLVTGDTRIIATGDNYDWPQWSPDGTQIGYAKHISSSEFEIWTCDADGTNSMYICTVMSPGGYFYGWSPTGSRLIYRRKPGGNACADTPYSVALDGTDEQVFLDPSFLGDISVYGITIDRANNEIYWSSSDGCNSPSLELYRASVAGDSIITATTVQLTSNGQYDDISQHAHAAGKLAFWRAVDHPYSSTAMELFVMNDDGTSPQRLTFDQDADMYALLAPEGDYVLWSSKEQGDFAVMGMDLTDSTTSPVWNSPEHDMLFDWLADGPEPQIRLVKDVGNDQGRQVRISIARALYDAPGSGTPIVQYEVYRQVDQALKRANSLESTLSDTSALTSQWDYLGAIPAHGDVRYDVIAATLADSTISGGMYLSSFFVRAATADPYTYFDSPVMSGYSVDNLAPASPSAMAVAYGASSNSLDWSAPDDPDVARYRIYEGTSPVFSTSGLQPIAETSLLSWTDNRGSGWGTYYMISAVDFSGNESAAASMATATDAPAATNSLALAQNSPNPFNPRTSIRFTIPLEDHVQLSVYDARGQLVRVLEDRRLAAGNYTSIWDGIDARGRAAASGTYFYRLEFAGKTLSGKMSLIK